MRMYYNGGGAAWTRKEGQSPSGGLNQKVEIVTKVVH